MIQRIQSIFLALSAACFGSLFGFPFASSNITSAGIFSDKVYNLHDHTLFLVLVALGIILSLAAIFVFNNRTLQIRLVIFSIISYVFLVVSAILIFINIQLPANLEISDQAGIYLPFAGLILAGLAIRYIKKDENLVQSMDRLR
jgi:hypothetical protein